MKYLDYLFNAILFVCLAKAIYEPQTMTVAIFAIAMLGTLYKSYEKTKKEIIEEKIQEHAERYNARMYEVQEQIAKLGGELESYKKVQAQLEKSSEDIKKVISTANLGQALYTRTRK